MNTTLYLSGLHCQACVARVKSALAPFASEVTITLAPQQTATLSDPSGTFEQWAAAIARVGAYTASLTPPAPAVGASAVSAAASVTRVATNIPIKPKAAPTGDSVPTAQGSAAALPAKSLQTYYPLLLLAAFLVFIPILAQWGSGQPFDGQAWMRHFMAAFFLAFSFFKLLDVRAFAQAYAGYDLVAKAWAPWGFLYPFVELALGIAYLVNFNPTITNTVTLVVMGVSLIGVVRAVLSKQAIRCACLGAVFNLPMSTVTIIEDGLMVAMAAWMLLSA